MATLTVEIRQQRDVIAAIKVLWEAGLITLDQMREAVRREQGR